MPFGTSFHILIVTARDWQATGWEAAGECAGQRGGYENEVQGERICAGQTAARARSKTWDGYQKGRRIKVTTEQVEVVRRLKKDGMKIAAIARAVGLSRPTVYSVIHEQRQIS